MYAHVHETIEIAEKTRIQKSRWSHTVNLIVLTLA